MLDSLKEEGPKNWARFEQCLRFFKDTILDHEELIEIMRGRMLASFFIDFMLGNKSPICPPHEKRYPMGSTVPPSFGPIVIVIS
jgi:hypothetical protein